MSASSATISGQVTGKLGSFLSWWGGELMDMLPAPLHHRASPGIARVVVSIEQTGLALLEEEAGKLEPAAVDNIPRPAVEVLARIATLGEKRPIGLRIRWQDCFVRRVELPAAARADFDRILGLELERVTPFRPSDVHAAHCIVGKGLKAGTLEVLHVVARRSTIDPMLAEMARNGIKVGFVDIWNAERTAAVPIDFLKTGQAKPPSWRSGSTLALAAIAALSLLSALGLHIYGRSEAVQRLEAEVASARSKVQVVQRRNEARDQVAAERAQIFKARQERPPVTRILEEVTRLLPDKAYLLQLRVDGDTIDMNGLAQSSSELLKLFEQSGTFVDARLTSPLRLEAGEERERFSIRMQVRRPQTETAVTTGKGKS